MKTIFKTTLAIIMVMVMLGAFTLSAPTASAADKVAHVVVTEKVDGAIDITRDDAVNFLLAFMTEDELIELMEDNECLADLYFGWDDHVITVDLDGMVHLNLKAWTRNDCLDVKMEAFWHGTIIILIDGEEVLELDIKNLQIMTHVTLCESECPEHVIINAHLNGDATVLEEFDLDIKAHLLLHYVNGQFMFKLWLPDFMGLLIYEC